MSVCPLDFRYGNAEMKAIFSEENKLRCLLEVEAALALVHAEMGTIPKEAAEAIARAARDGSVSTFRVNEIEAEIRHDIMAVIRGLTEKCPVEAGKYVHLGATSNDIIDTSTGLQIAQAHDLVRAGVEKVRDEFVRLAEEHRDTVMVGRTHGQFAIPTTFGLKMAVYALEMQRHVDRLNEGEKRFKVGKMLGAVGTGASFGKKALELQEKVMKRLGLHAPIATTQVLQRDRYAEIVCLMANITATLEKFATEVRNLQRGEILEAAEGFDKEKQVGSSTMSHKRNPIISENICGLARVVRGFVMPAYENIPLWHERDLTNSSAERFIIPHVYVLTDYILGNSVKLLGELEVFENNMRANLARAGDDIMAESVIMVLVEKGMGRQDAHELTRQLSIASRGKEGGLRMALKRDVRIGELLSSEEIDTALDPMNYLGSTNEIIDMVKKKCV